MRGDDRWSFGDTVSCAGVVLMIGTLIGVLVYGVVWVAGELANPDDVTVRGAVVRPAGECDWWQGCPVLLRVEAVFYGRARERRPVAPGQTVALSVRDRAVGSVPVGCRVTVRCRIEGDRLYGCELFTPRVDCPEGGGDG